MNKNEVKILNKFLRQTKINKNDFAETAGVSVSSLSKAMKSGNVSDEVANKIFGAIVSESLQYKLITGKDPRIVHEIQIAYIITWFFIITFVLTLIWFLC